MQDGSVAANWTVAQIKRENLTLGKECLGRYSNCAFTASHSRLALINFC
jgi:hypothetical protein